MKFEVTEESYNIREPLPPMGEWRRLYRISRTFGEIRTALPLLLVVARGFLGYDPAGGAS